jgi:hypothetical protein
MTRPGMSIPYKIDCHQCKAASDATGMEVVVDRVEEAPALSSLMMRWRHMGKNFANVIGAFADERLRTSSPIASTAFGRHVVDAYSAI